MAPLSRFLASGYQWKKMIDTYGLSNLKTTAGDYTGLQSSNYWSSSEDNARYAWYFFAGNGYWNRDRKGYGYLDRACLAF